MQRVSPCVLALIVALPVAVEAQQSTNPVVTAVAAGMTCKGRVAVFGPKLDCEYHVGKSLYFTVNAVGQESASFTIMKSDFWGDYYVTVGGLHDCLTVKEGEETMERLRSEGQVSLPQFAFVSRHDGKVYASWPECARSRLKREP